MSSYLSTGPNPNHDTFDSASGKCGLKKKRLATTPWEKQIERETIVEHENNLERDYDYVIGTVEIDYRARRVISLVKFKFILVLGISMLYLQKNRN